MQIFAFSPSPANSESASAAFEQALMSRAKLYGELFRKSYGVRRRTVAGVHIGQIACEVPVRDWKSWCEVGDDGVAWAGICEDFLGNPESPSILTTLHERASDVLDWTGRFAAISWRRSEVVITQAATEPASLWYASGPRGFAVGSRACLVAQLAGLAVQIDPVSAATFFLYGYLVSDESLIAGCRRIPPLHRILINGASNVPRPYADFAQWIGKPGVYRIEQAAAQAAIRLASRVERQLQHSLSPTILLTGGRDSRSIAAAMPDQYQGIMARTGGSGASADVIIARRVAECLGLPHEVDADFPAAAYFETLNNQPKRMLLWSRASEGLETIRHALSFRWALDPAQPLPEFGASFHGLGGEISRGYYYGAASKVDIALSSRGPRLSALKDSFIKRLAHTGLASDVAERVSNACDHVTKEIHSIDGTAAHWLDLYYLRCRAGKWGQDMMAVKDAFSWRWTPLYDRNLIQAAWCLPPDAKHSSRFVERMTLVLAPELAGIGYDKAKGKSSRAVRKVVHLWRKLRGEPSPGSKLPSIPRLSEYWESLFSSRSDGFWRTLIGESSLRELLRTDPSSEPLWNLATVELAHTAINSDLSA